MVQPELAQFANRRSLDLGTALRLTTNEVDSDCCPRIDLSDTLHHYVYLDSPPDECPHSGCLCKLLYQLHGARNGAPHLCLGI